MINDDLHIVHARAAGLDVHKMKITATVRICEANGGQAKCETREFSALPSGLSKLSQWLVDVDVSIAGMEGTGIYWQAPWNALNAVGIEVELYHAQHVKQLRGRKTDIEDSRWLARICQFGLGRASLVVTEEFRQLRSLSRHRRKVVKDRSRVRNRVQKVIDRGGVRIGGILTDVFGMNGRRIIDGLAQGRTKAQILGTLSNHIQRKMSALHDAMDAKLSKTDCFMLSALLEQHDFIGEQLRQCDAQIQTSLEPFEAQVRLLETIPGVSRQSACDIVIEIGGDCGVFDNRNQFSSWCGLAPGNNESAGKRRNAHSVRGNPHIRSVLVECAIAAARTKDCQFKGYHKAIHLRRGYKRATVATAHKLAKVIFSVLTNGTAYMDPNFDYEALMVKRNAARWLSKLHEYGYMEHPQRNKAIAA